MRCIDIAGTVRIPCVLPTAVSPDRVAVVPSNLPAHRSGMQTNPCQTYGFGCFQHLVQQLDQFSGVQTTQSKKHLMEATLERLGGLPRYYTLFNDFVQADFAQPCAVNGALEQLVGTSGVIRPALVEDMTRCDAPPGPPHPPPSACNAARFLGRRLNRRSPRRRHACADARFSVSEPWGVTRPVRPPPQVADAAAPGPESEDGAAWIAESLHLGLDGQLAHMQAFVM